MEVALLPKKLMPAIANMAHMANMADLAVMANDAYLKIWCFLQEVAIPNLEFGVFFKEVDRWNKGKKNPLII